MTEYNLFCFSRNCNDSESFQQSRYRAFNKQLTETRFNEILKEVNKILEGFKYIPQKGWSRSWEEVTPEQWQKLLDIPEASDFKEGFEYISGVKIKAPNPSCDGKEVVMEGAKYRLQFIGNV